MKTKLAFVSQPRAAVVSAQFEVSVAVQDVSGSKVTLGSDAVTLSLGADPGAGTLLGSLTVGSVNGLATFRDLRIEQPGSGYTLIASASGLAEATSTSFAISRSIPLSFASVSASSGHSCGVTAANDAYCWGVNSWGHLGDGTTATRSTPTLVTGGLSFASVSVGGGHSCGVTVQGAAYCWGENVQGQLGDGTRDTTNRRSLPTAVLGGLSFASVSAGRSHTCGVTATGDAYCWGQNPSLGDGSTTSSPTPVLVAGGLSFASVSVGVLHICGVTVGGLGYCWGVNGAGQLGDRNHRWPIDSCARGGWPEIRFCESGQCPHLRGHCRGPRLLLGRERVRSAR